MNTFVIDNRNPLHPANFAVLSTDSIVLLAALMRQWHNDHAAGWDASAGWMPMPDIAGLDPVLAMQNLCAYGYAERTPGADDLRFRITAEGRAALIGDLIRMHGELAISRHLAERNRTDSRNLLAEIDRLKSVIASKDSDLKEANDYAAELESTNARQTDELQDARTALSAFRSAYDREHQRAGELAQEAGLAKSRVADLESALKDRKQVTASIKADYDRADQRAREAAQEARFAKSRVIDLEAALEAATRGTTPPRRELHHLQTWLRESDTAIAQSLLSALRTDLPISAGHVIDTIQQWIDVQADTDFDAEVAAEVER